MSQVFQDFVERYGPPAGEEGPILLVREIFGAEPDPWQETVLRGYGRGERRISVASCHGPGKTAVAAWCSWHSLLTRFPQKTAVTAPSGGQLEDGLLREMAKWGEKLPPGMLDLYDVTKRRITLKASPDRSFFSARTARAEKPEALQGIHEDEGYVLLIADEASAVPEPVFESAAGSMSGHRATTLLISNPTRTSGLFFDTHHKLKDMWLTIQVGYKDSTRVDPDFEEDIARRYGRESTAYRVRVLGLFPLTDEDTVIPWEAVNSARERDVEIPKRSPRVWGVDVARFGGDKNALVVRAARGIPEPPLKWSGTDLMQSASKIYDKWLETPETEKPEFILVDVIGMGGGVVDRLKQLGLPARGVNVGEAAPTKERYLNQRAELWWKAREWFLAKDCSIPAKNPEADEQSDPMELLCQELVVPKYDFAPSGKIRLESKVDMKKRIGYSPDIADAFVLTFATDLALLSGSNKHRPSWSQPLKRNVGVV